MLILLCLLYLMGTYFKQLYSTKIPKIYGSSILRYLNIDNYIEPNGWPIAGRLVAVIKTLDRA